ncbi:thioesterase II family protein [Streptomyces sp. GC420]|uniref:thioesterase II family protein n=1 Tax=Streptomyces sp. GC420 TaxID=2697568 RepID=UPI0014150044|nr:alpha/beta fold hydrolase [Streptomyces sp. GC420]NBM16042.1 alpha/beta fold hydrolase [Streptomyces sp. GC420]
MQATWFRRFAEPRPDAPRLICFPHAGGAASAYAPWSRRLSGMFDVVSVQYPGRQDRRSEPPAAGILDLAARIADGLGQGDHRPYAFFGHSMGALVAYETTRILQSRSAPAPVRLFLSGRGAPGTTPDRHDHTRGDAAILAAVRNLGGTDASVLDDPELVDMVMPALRADYGALAAYRWEAGPVLNVPVTVLVGDSDPVVPVASVAGWARQTRQDNEVLVFGGGHFYLSERVDEVCAIVADRLTTLTGGSSGIPGSRSAGGLGGRAETGTGRTQTTSVTGTSAPAG